MKLLLVICAVLAVSQAQLGDQEWLKFKLLHRKVYADPAEETLRMNIYLENKKKIDDHNEKFAKGEVTYSMAMNHFGDLRHDEFLKMVNGYNSTLGEEMHKLGKPYVRSSRLTRPSSIDWRSQGAVSEVKNQGQCGSCWSFSATGSIEGQVYLATGRSVSLSEQNLMDCSYQYGNRGCSGGVMQYAFQYVVDNGGIDEETSYPYESGTFYNCQYDPNTSAASLSGYVSITPYNEDELTDAVGTVGPVSVAMDASLDSLTFYSGGIYNDDQCSSTKLDHGVLAVGYGSDGDKDYWIIKNSWGTSWGDKGYFLIARNANNLCGLATQATYPIYSAATVNWITLSWWMVTALSTIATIR